MRATTKATQVEDDAKAKRFTREYYIGLIVLSVGCALLSTILTIGLNFWVICRPGNSTGDYVCLGAFDTMMFTYSLKEIGSAIKCLIKIALLEFPDQQHRSQLSEKYPLTQSSQG